MPRVKKETKYIELGPNGLPLRSPKKDENWRERESEIVHLALEQSHEMVTLTVPKPFPERLRRRKAIGKRVVNRELIGIEADVWGTFMQYVGEMQRGLIVSELIYFYLEAVLGEEKLKMLGVERPDFIYNNAQKTKLLNEVIGNAVVHSPRIWRYVKETDNETESETVSEVDGD